MPKFLDKMERAGGENFSLPKFLDKRERAGEKLQVAVQFVGRSFNSWGGAPIPGEKIQVAVQFVGRSSNSWGRAPRSQFELLRGIKGT